MSNTKNGYVGSTSSTMLWSTGRGRMLFKALLVFLRNIQKLILLAKKLAWHNTTVLPKLRIVRHMMNFGPSYLKSKGWVEQEGATMVEVMALEQALEEWLVNHICAIDVQLRDVVASSWSARSSNFYRRCVLAASRPGGGCAQGRQVPQAAFGDAEEANCLNKEERSVGSFPDALLLGWSG